MRTIRASEINAFLYCQRAWWYQKNGYIPANQAELNHGKFIHEEHGRAAAKIACFRVLAYILLLSALILLTIHLTLHFYR